MLILILTLPYFQASIDGHVQPVLSTIRAQVIQLVKYVIKQILKLMVGLRYPNRFGDVLHVHVKIMQIMYFVSHVIKQNLHL